MFCLEPLDAYFVWHTFCSILNRMSIKFLRMRDQKPTIETSMFYSSLFIFKHKSIDSAMTLR